VVAEASAVSSAMSVDRSITRSSGTEQRLSCAISAALAGPHEISPRFIPGQAVAPDDRRRGKSRIALNRHFQMPGISGCAHRALALAPVEVTANQTPPMP
jgi:hypothetical protein